MAPGASWNIDAPVDGLKVLTFVEQLQQIDPSQAFNPSEFDDRQKYGLDSPDFTLELFRSQGAEPFVMKFTAEQGVVYGWNSDRSELIFVFPEEILETVGRPASHFLDTSVFSFEEEKVVGVQLVQPFGSSWLVERSDDGFAFALPGYLKDKPVSDSALKLYIHGLSLLNASEFLVESDEADDVMSALTVKLTLEGEKEPQRLDIYASKADQDSFVGRSSWLTAPFVINAGSVNQLVKSAFDIQGRTVVQLDTGTVATFKVITGICRQRRRGAGH